MERNSKLRASKKPGGNVVAEWQTIPSRIRKSIRGLSKADLELRAGAEGWSIREHVHHLVEANLVASNIIIAALVTDGYNFDWTWVNPDKSWMKRMGYNTADVGLALRTLTALCNYLSQLLSSNLEKLTKRVKLNDAPGAERYVMTVDQILRQEIEHANDHLGQIQVARSKLKFT